MYIQNRKIHRHRKQLYGYQKGEWEGQIRGMRLTDTKNYNKMEGFFLTRWLVEDQIWRGNPKFEDFQISTLSSLSHPAYDERLSFLNSNKMTGELVAERYEMGGL